MANYNGFTVTEKTFQVLDVEAFKKAFEPLHTNMEIHIEADGQIWIGGYGASMNVLDENDEDVDIADIIQEHIKPGDYAVIQSVGHEKLRYVSGYTCVINKEKILNESLSSMTTKLKAQLEEKD